jgi:pyruvate carboxylase subunit A
MLDTVLVANRGEIAIRIIRACRSLNFKAIALFAEDDSNSLHVKMADEAYSLGKGTVQDTYLNIEKIIDIAKESGSTAIHPGYGFLSESSLFAEKTINNKLLFIGPKPEIINQLGDKMEAKKIANEVDIPLVPGSIDYVSTLEQAEEIAEEIGYPLMIKAAFGGGGKGMEVVHSPSTLEISLLGCQTVSQRFFGRKEVFIEKFITNPRHIEIQFLADNFGNVVHLGDRECSIQRAHQKIIEEAPSFLNDEVRNKLGEKVCALAERINYQNAGTAEFLWKDNQLFFNEINPRIQVEHPVTEMITGTDLVVQQLKVANNEELSFKQEEISFRGHAIEFRINAEDPLKSFYPQSGTITGLNIPGGNSIRFDTALFPSYILPNSYDSLIGKLIVWGDSRREVIEKSRHALQELAITGVTTNIALHKAILETPEFLSREITTDFLEINKIQEILDHYDKMKLAAVFRIYEQNKDKIPSILNDLRRRGSDYNRWKEQSKFEQQRRYP